MFAIMYRITENLESFKKIDEIPINEESGIEGFFEMNFNERTYGYFHNNPLKDGEEGFELLTNWFDSLLKVSINLNHTGYALLNDIESYNTWIEFKKTHGSNIFISIIESDKPNGVCEVITEQVNNYKYGEWNNISINFNEFNDELISKTENFLDELSEINQKLLESNRITNIKKLLMIVKGS